jgi:phosphoglycerate dehydrogenase-like enzyme
MQNTIRKTIRVLFIWEVREELREYLQTPFNNHPNVMLIFPQDLSDENIHKLASDVDIIVGWRPTKEMLEKAFQLKLYINPGAGVQHLLELFREINEKREIILVNGHGNSYFTAQHAVTLLLALMNQIIPHHTWMVEGKWRIGDKDAKSSPLRDRHIGLLGYGAVNSKVHRFLSGFQVEFGILKRSWEHLSDEIPTPIEKFTPDQLVSFLKWTDILIIAVPQTAQTENLINSSEIQLLGKNGIIVNIARGSVINEEALYHALKHKEILGAAIDVWYDYKPKEDNIGKKYPFHQPFHQLDNVVLSPHRGASPFDDLKRWDEVIENINRFSQNRVDFMNQVDLSLGY